MVFATNYLYLVKYCQLILFVRKWVYCKHKSMAKQREVKNLRKYITKSLSFLVIICLSIAFIPNSALIANAVQTQSANSSTIRFAKDLDSVKDNLFGVAYGNNMFVAVGRDGAVKTSSDGVNWITRSISKPTLLLSIIYASDRFITVGAGGTIFTSTDGTIWTEKPSGIAQQLNAIAWDGNKFVAVGASGSIIFSTDGNTWTHGFSGTTNDLLDVVYNGSIFVAVGAGGTILTSTDGNTWAQRTSNKTGGLRSIAWNGSKFVALGGDYSGGDNGPKLTSKDGVTWTPSAWTKNLTFLNKVISNGNIFVASGVSLDSSGSFYTSTDGTNWTVHSPSLGLTNAIYGIAYGNNILIAVGYDGIILSSSDGAEWAIKVTPGTHDWYNALVTAGDKIITVGTSGSIMSSQDTLTWTKQTSERLGQLHDIAWNGNQTVAVGESGILATSPAGAAWAAVNDGSYYTVTWDGSRFVAIGIYGNVAASSDGFTWTNLPSISSIFSINDVTYNGSKYVAVGRNYSGATPTPGIIMNSTDGTSWNPVYNSNGGMLESVAWNGSQFVAVGGRPLSSSPIESQTILTSSDGTNWTSVTSSSDHALKSVIWDGSRFVAVGYGGAILASADGTNWTVMNSGTVHDLNDIAFYENQYIVVGDSGLILRGYESTAAGIQIDGPDTISIWPGVSGGFYSYTASVKDQYGNQMNNQPVTWSKVETDISGIAVDGDLGTVRIVGAVPNTSFTLKATLKSNNSIIGTKTVSLVQAPVKVTNITILGPSIITVPKNITVWACPQFTAVVSTERSPVSDEQVNWSLLAPVPEGISLIGATIDIDFKTIKACSFTIKAVSITNPSVTSTKAVSVVVESSPVAAAQLAGFAWAPGSTPGTTKTDKLPEGTLKYVVGSTNMQVHPNVGDAATVYTNTLSVNTNITVTAGQHIYIVRVDNNGAITDWADITVDAANINSTSVTNPSSNPPPQTGGDNVPPAGNNILPAAGIVPSAVGGLPPSNSTPDNGVVTIVPIVTNNIARAEIDLADYEALLDSATVINGVKNITIKIDNPSSSAYTTELPVTSLTKMTKDVNTTISTAVARVTVPSNMFSGITAKEGMNIGINISKVDKSVLPAAVSGTVGSAPVVNISATVNGEVKAWNNPDAPVTVSIPYNLKEGESPDKITVFYIDNTGKLENMQGVYKSDTKMVTFTTTHFSRYFAKENKISFTDLAGYESYKKYIEDMASKGIIEGIGHDQYAPGKALTRSEFAALLVKILKLDRNNTKNIFKDVNSSIWYAAYINAAYKAGLVEGVGSGMFAPEAVITSQDAALILVRALKYKGSKITAGSLSKVKDIQTINKYALDAVGFTVSNRITPLDANGNFNATRTVNRASAAEYIYNIFYFNN
jgi:hypothetical protein